MEARLLQYQTTDQYGCRGAFQIQTLLRRGSGGGVQEEKRNLVYCSVYRAERSSMVFALEKH